MEKIKNHIIIALFTMIFIPVSFAQQGSKKEKIEQLKIAFITQELQLSPEEAQNFWPIYNEMNKKIKAEKKSQRKVSRELKENKENYSEGEFERKSLAVLDSQIKSAQLKKDYHNKIGAVIGFKKATKLLSLEQRFKQELLNRVNNGGNKNGGNKPNGPHPNRNN